MMIKIFNRLSFVFFLLASRASFAEEIKDVRAPVAFPPNYILFIAILALVIMGAIILLIYYFKKRIAKIKEKSVKRISPWENAYTKLQDLINEDLLSKGLFIEFYLRLSDIVRQYFEEQFNVKAPEMTSEEFLLHMRNSDLLDDSQKGSLKDFLFHCDMVKFAKYFPSVEEGKKSIDIAKRLIEETKIENNSTGSSNV